jgi:hypothetical protein
MRSAQLPIQGTEQQGLEADHHFLQVARVQVVKLYLPSPVHLHCVEMN